MPNEALITQLDALHVAYVQQQKTAAALQKALKGVSDTQNKAQKALREYSARNSGADTGPAQEALAQLRLKEDVIDPLQPDLRRELKTLAAWSAALRDASAALRSEPVDVTRLDKALTHLQTDAPGNITALLPELNQELDVAQRQLGDEFGVKLRDALAVHGVALGGRPPRFEIGRFELDANFARRFLTLRYGKDIVVPRATITVAAALKAYENAAKAIQGRAVDGKAWIGQFHEAWQRVRRKQGASNARVNIVDCYIELAVLRQGRGFFVEPSKRTFSDYSRAQFSFDFYEITQRQRLTHDGQVVRAHIATKSQAESAARSLWIVEGDTPYDGRFISDVEFVKE